MFCDVRPYPTPSHLWRERFTKRSLARLRRRRCASGRRERLLLSNCVTATYGHQTRLVGRSLAMAAAVPCGVFSSVHIEPSFLLFAFRLFSVFHTSRRPEFRRERAPRAGGAVAAAVFTTVTQQRRQS